MVVRRRLALDPLPSPFSHVASSFAASPLASPFDSLATVSRDKVPGVLEGLLAGLTSGTEGLPSGLAAGFSGLDTSGLPSSG